MNKIKLGIAFGIIFGALDVLSMVPLELPNKLIAMEAAFVGRFAIGFLIPNIQMPTSSWIKGFIVGFLLSFPDAIITGAYAPILGIGILGGAIIGLIEPYVIARVNMITKTAKER